MWPSTATTLRVPAVVTSRTPSITSPAIVSNTITWPVFDSAGRPCAPGTPVASAPSSTRRSWPSWYSATMRSPSSAPPPPARRLGSRFVASVTNAIWLPSALTAGAQDDAFPARGTPTVTTPASIADTIASGSLLGGSSKMPLPSVSRSNRYTCEAQVGTHFGKRRRHEHAVARREHDDPTVFGHRRRCCAGGATARRRDPRRVARHAADRTRTGPTRRPGWPRTRPGPDRRPNPATPRTPWRRPRTPGADRSATAPAAGIHGRGRPGSAPRPVFRRPSVSRPGALTGTVMSTIVIVPTPSGDPGTWCT